MPIKLGVVNKSQFRLPSMIKRRVTVLTRQVARVAGKKYGEVGLAFVGDLDIRKLNRQYRRHDKVTDVLSFTYTTTPITGEIIICLPQAERQARRKKHTLIQELDILVTHGLFHLAGHDHMRIRERERMRVLERRVLKGSAKK